jgi:hydrogenase maturation protein HypF
MALSYLYAFLGREGLLRHLPIFAHTGEEKIPVILRQIDRHINSPLTSSCGRLFDAVSALLGLCVSVSYEGQAAVELEMIASAGETGAYEFFVEEGEGKEIIRLKPMIEGILRDLEKGTAHPVISGKFHNSLVKIGLSACQRIQRQGGPKKVALTGGVFQNRLLSEKMKSALEEAGFAVLLHRRVPCNDGGLSLGQAVIANFIGT